MLYVRGIRGEGAGASVQRLLSVTTFTKDHQFLCILSGCHFSELCAGWQHTPASPALPPRSTEHRRFGSGKAGRAAAGQDVTPAGRIAAIPRGTSFLRGEEPEGEVPPFSHPTQTPRSPTAPLTSSGLPSPSGPGSPPISWGLPPPLTTPHAAWPEHFHSHRQSIIKSVRGRRKQRGPRCTLLPHLPLGFLCQPQADRFSLIVTSAHSLNAVE